MPFYSVSLAPLALLPALRLLLLPSRAVVHTLWPRLLRLRLTRLHTMLPQFLPKHKRRLLLASQGCSRKWLPRPVR